MAPRLPVVAVVGRPNVGKSTFFNRVLGQRLAIDVLENKIPSAVLLLDPVDAGHVGMAQTRERLGLTFEYLDEESADDLAFFFRVLNTSKGGHEPLGRIHAANVNPHVGTKCIHDLLGLIEP